MNFARPFFLLTASALLLTGITASAAQGWLPPTVLNTNGATDTGLDSTPCLVTGGSTWITVWESTDSLGGTISTDDDILFARSTDHGATWSAPAALASNADTDSGSDTRPRLATDGAGTWLAVWHSDDNLGGTVGTDHDIFYSRSTDDGITWSAVAALNSNASTDTGGDYWPVPATDRNGNWVVVWYSNGDLGGTIGNDNDILYSRSSNNGASWSAVAVLNTNAATDDVAGHDYYPVVATDGSGNWVAAWVSNEDLGGTIGTDADILFARSTDNGATWTAPGVLNSTATTDSSWDRPVDLQVDSMGHWVAAWDTDNVAILCSRSADDGATWSAVATLNANAATSDGAALEPRLAVGQYDEWIAVWESFDTRGGTLGKEGDILFARSNDSGINWTYPAVLNHNAAKDLSGDWLPCVAADDLGYWGAAWSFYGDPATGESDILFSRSGPWENVALGSIFDVDGTAVAGLPGGVFRLTPKIYTIFYDPVSLKLRTVKAKVLTKPDSTDGTQVLSCKWPKKIRLYSTKAYKAEEKIGGDMLEWIDGHIYGLSMELHVAGKEVVDQMLRPLALPNPLINSIVDGDPDPKGNPTLLVVGHWFGSKKPKAWREYIVDGVVKRQAMKVLLDGTIVDEHGKPSGMDPYTGESKFIVVIPAAPKKGFLTDHLILDNGVGLATGIWPF